MSKLKTIYMDNFNVAQSPYGRDFESILDPGIRELVMALVHKGHLPSYSCEGHRLYKPRYIVVCFGCDDSRSDFRKRLFRSWERFLFPIEELDTLSYEKIGNRCYYHQSREDEIRGLNKIFLKRYTKYCFLRINIGVAIHNRHPGSSWARDLHFKVCQLYASVVNFFVRERLTSILTKRVSQLEHSIY